MLAELVAATTLDGVELGGAYFPPTRGKRLGGVDAVLFFHGDGGHFYRPLYLGLGERFAAERVAFLSANRRGHDLVSRGAAGGPLAGYAFESVSDARADCAAWLALLRSRGHRRVAVGGHSGGAVRAVYAQAAERYADVAAVVAVSPGEYRHQTVVDLHGDAFRRPFAQAQADLRRGRPDVFLQPGVPWGSMWTARTFVDCFNPDDRYSVTAHAANTGCPTLCVFGSRECAGPEQLPVCGAACRALQAAAYPGVAVTVVDGANHGYAGREQQLFDAVLAWLQTV